MCMINLLPIVILQVQCYPGCQEEVRPRSMTCYNVNDHDITGRREAANGSFSTSSTVYIVGVGVAGVGVAHSQICSK